MKILLGRCAELGREVDLDHMNQGGSMKLGSMMVLILLAPHLALAQWTEPQPSRLIVRGGSLFNFAFLKL